MPYLNNSIDKLVRMALIEDIGSGDRTTSILVDPELRGHAKVIANETLIVAGIHPFVKSFQFLSSEIEFLVLSKQGAVLHAGETLAELIGPYSTLLTGERTALNFLQHLCGIATMTYSFSEKIKHFDAVLLDTRKTTPGWRVLEKEAVCLGGGTNHRMGLFDAVLIKENHIAACGGIRNAVEKVKKVKNPHIFVEIEVKNIKELEEAIDAGPDMIMLDNMSVEDMKKAVKITGGRIPLEASGNVTIVSIENIASTGVNYISAGAVTHSAGAVDISMNIEPEGV
jgi:nicotinate-nucleotide pyrophosphorylase (carboxylating)